ncbi:MAG: Gfo/Idh/MocA family protein [Peptostreptococcaceae bacterium]
MKKIKVAVIGAGVRGTYAYTPYFLQNPNLCEIVAVAETKKGRRDLFAKKYSIDENLVFESADDFFEKEKMADAVIISTSDDRHFKHTKQALEKGYHILVEKPMANSLDGLVNLRELIKKYPHNIIMTCHPLRYSKFFKKLKEIIDNKELGNLVSIQYNEEIGYLDYVHNFVRGNNRNSSDTSPLILSRSCDDLDILLYFTDSSSEKVASFGSLKHFNSENFNLAMSENCYRCSKEIECPYSCKKIYLEDNRVTNNSVHINPTKENLDMILKEGPYGRCVYRCDNNVVDNMVSIINFENNITATFNLSAFTKESNRFIKLMFAQGEVEGSFKDNKIMIKKFGIEDEIVIELEKDKDDMNIIKEFISLINKEENNQFNLSINQSIESNIVAFAMEYSMVSEEVVYVREFLNNAIEMTKEIEIALS